MSDETLDPNDNRALAAFRACLAEATNSNNPEVGRIPLAEEGEDVVEAANRWLVLFNYQLIRLPNRRGLHEDAPTIVFGPANPGGYPHYCLHNGEGLVFDPNQRGRGLTWGIHSLAFVALDPYIG